MKGYVAEIDSWTVSGSKITDAEKFQLICETLKQKGPIILEHCFYRGGRGPETFVFVEYEEFVNYLNTHGRAGDYIAVWSFWDVCKSNNILTSGKCPDDSGRVPEKGAY